MSPDPQPWFMGVDAQADVDPLLRKLRHDLRTPINHVIGYCELLLEDSAPDQPEGLAQDLLRILNAGRELLTMVNESLASDQISPQDLAVMGNRFRSPLNAIIGYSELLCEDLCEVTDRALLDDLHRIQSAGRQLLPMVNKALELWLDCSRTSAGADLVAQTSVASQALARDLDLQAEAEEAPDLGGLILVVDDNAVNRDILNRRLTRLGYEVATAENGREALDRLSAGRFDLVLLDIIMPIMNGFEVLDRMKADPLLRNIPVIVLSAVDETQSAVDSIRRGAEDYLPKPFDPVLLKARIRSSMQRKRWRDQEEVYRQQIEEEKRRADDLLHVILPQEIVAELKLTQQVVPRRYENVAVMFCDIVSFTDYCDKRTPQEVMPDLQCLIEAFETIALDHELDKIKTIGDSFMAAAGLLKPSECPVSSCVRAAVAMHEACRVHPAGWDLRIGIHVGPVVGGLLGHRQYLFDLFGDTVNTASRMEHHGLPGGIVLSSFAWERIASRASAQALGPIQVKGKGEIDMFCFQCFHDEACSAITGA